MGEAKRRREAVARGEPDPGPVGIKGLGRHRQKAQLETLALQRFGVRRAEEARRRAEDEIRR
jgi:hypothetical protein